MKSTLTHDVVAAVEAIFADAGIEGAVCAKVLGRPEVVEVRVDADRIYPTASLYKLPLIIAFVRACEEGLVDPREQVRLEPSQRTRGGTGLSVLLDPVTMSWRDLARMAVTVSDNAAGDALLHLLGEADIGAMLSTLGAECTHVRGGAALTLDLVAEQHGHEVVKPADINIGQDSHALDPKRVSSTTPADMVRLVEQVWMDQAASAPGCAFVREVLSQQVWAHRFAGAFSYPGVSIAAKTGSLGPLRHEAGAVQHRDEPPVILCVMTRAARRDPSLPRADAAVGAAARELVQFLRQFL